MKYLTALIAVAALINSPGSAQDYRAFYGAESRIFQLNANQPIEMIFSAVSVDTVSFDGDSLYHFAPNWHRLDAPNDLCHTPTGPSLLGDSARVSPDGTHSFYNYIGEQIEIRPQALPQSIWTAYTFPSGEGTIQAEVVSITTENVLGTLENVKTISLTRFSESMEPIDSPINALYFKIGETTGMIETPELRYFPQFTNQNFPEMIFLAGIESVIGMQNLKWFEIMDFQPGDIFEVETYTYGAEGGSLTYESERYLARSDYADSIVYEVEIRTWGAVGLESPEYAQLEFVDSVVVERVILMNPGIDAQPGTPDILTDYGPEGQILMRYGDFGREKIYAMEPNIYGIENDSTFCLYWDTEGCAIGAKKIYVERLGGPYYICAHQWDSGLRWRVLKYFNKGDETWGTPFNPLSLSIPSTIDELIEVFPIPASDLLQINLPANLSAGALRVTDLHGRLIRQTTGTRLTYLQVNEIKSGVYILHITLDTGQTIARKILIGR